MEFSSRRAGGLYNWEQQEAQRVGGRIDEINEEGGGAASASAEEEGAPPPQAAAAAVVEREHMFDKVVTPSDVGKLNRLVIPKQHAERYFPLDANSNEKGLLLSFEDRNGKPWRFRYSYWNSSQSYVMTKGWSRFVKEKQLDAGDTVSFGRGVGEAGRDRLFIDWKRRPHESHHDLVAPYGLPRFTLPFPLRSTPSHSSILSFARSAVVSMPPSSWSGSSSSLFGPSPTSTTHSCHRSYPSYNAPYLYFRTAAEALPDASKQQFGSGAGEVGGTNIAATTVAPIVLDAVPVVPHNKALGKRVRIFGVNLDCPIQDSSSHDEDNAPPLQLQLGWAGASSEHPHQHW